MREKLRSPSSLTSQTVIEDMQAEHFAQTFLAAIQANIAQTEKGIKALHILAETEGKNADFTILQDMIKAQEQKLLH